MKRFLLYLILCIFSINYANGQVTPGSIVEENIALTPLDWANRADELNIKKTVDMLWSGMGFLEKQVQ